MRRLFEKVDIGGIKHTLSWAYLNVFLYLLISRLFHFEWYIVSNICLAFTLIFSFIWEVVEQSKDIWKGLAFAFVGFILGTSTAINVYIGFVILIFITIQVAFSMLKNNGQAGL